jgi:Fe-S cluster assembly iron-binding protein IscA
MLALTPTAVEVVRTITSSPSTPGTGLRIAAAADGPREGALELTVSPGPADDDQVVAGPDTQVFLDQRAAAYLDDKVLDVDVAEDGTPRFFVAEQGGTDTSHPN